MRKAGGTGEEIEPAATLSVSIRNYVFTDTYAIGNIGKKIEFTLKKMLEFSKINHWILLHANLDVKLASRWHDPAPQCSLK